jgi:hypothetical protein
MNNNLQTVFKQPAPYGNSPEGSAWMMKSVHPSSAPPEFKGIPDGYSRPVVPVNYNQMFTITPPTTIGTDGTWEVSINVPLHPVTFAMYDTILTDGTGSTEVLISNEQLTGSTLAAKTTYLQGLAERYRLSYMSLTFHQDAPAMHDEGMVAAAQYYIGHRDVTSPTGTSVFQGHVILIDIANDVYTTYDNIVQMPSAYTGLAKQGLYTTMKTDADSRKWRSTNDMVNFSACSLVTADPSILATNDSLVPPYTNSGSYFTTSWQTGTPQVKPASYLMNRIFFKNLHATQNIVCTVHAGWEFETRVGTSLAPFQQMGPLLDPLALQMHDLIISSLMDGYPESYNSFETLKKVVAKIAGGVSKYVLPIAGIVAPNFQPVWDQLNKATKSLRDQLQSKVDKKQTAGLPDPTLKQLRIQRRGTLPPRTPVRLNIQRKIK